MEGVLLGYAPALPENIRQGLKWLAVTITLAYYINELITTVKSFKINISRSIADSDQKYKWGKFYKEITAVI